jgi:hypothetical protein
MFSKRRRLRGLDTSMQFDKAAHRIPGQPPGFPALRFIKQRESANKRRLQLRHLLLLCCRSAAIALLALALSRPSIRASGTFGDQESPVAAALVFDTSPRMQYRQQNKSRLEVAQETAQWLLPQLPADSEVAVLDAHSGLGAFAVDVAAARSRIDHLDTSAVSQPLAAACADALQLLADSAKTRKELYVFTDLTRPSWSTAGAQALAKQLKASPEVGVYVVDVGAHDPQNFGLANVRLSGQLLTKNSPLRIQCDLVHIGPAAERTVELFLIEDDGQSPRKEVKRGQVTAKAAENQSQQLEFRLGALPPGMHQGFLQIAGQDGLAGDDRAYFSVQVRPAWKVLIAAPKKAADYAWCLSEALRVLGYAECEIISLDDLSRRALDTFAAVYVLDPHPLPPSAWQQLSAYASGGGGVAIFLGHNATPIDSFNDAAAQDLLPGKLVRQWRAPDDSVYLAPDDLEHPILANFKAVATSVPWKSLPVYRFWQLGPLQETAAVVAAYSNRRPAIIEKPLGKGRVITMTTPISDPANDENSWNWIPTGEDSWPFLILTDGMLHDLVGSGESRLNYLAGQSAVLHLPPEQSHAMFSVTTPHGDLLRQAVDEKQQVLMVAATETVGNYQARAGGGESRVDLGFSVNLPAEASQLDRVSDKDLKAVFGDTPFQLAHSREEINRKVNLGRVGRELYPFLLVLLVLVLAVEQLLSNRFYGNDRGQESAARAGRSPARAAGNRSAVGKPAGDSLAAPAR